MCRTEILCMYRWNAGSSRPKAIRRASSRSRMVRCGQASARRCSCTSPPAPPPQDQQQAGRDYLRTFTAQFHGDPCVPAPRPWERNPAAADTAASTLNGGYLHTVPSGWRSDCNPLEEADTSVPAAGSGRRQVVSLGSTRSTTTITSTRSTSRTRVKSPCQCGESQCTHGPHSPAATLPSRL